MLYMFKRNVLTQDFSGEAGIVLKKRSVRLCPRIFTIGE